MRERLHSAKRRTACSPKSYQSTSSSYESSARIIPPPFKALYRIRKAISTRPIRLSRGCRRPSGMTCAHQTRQVTILSSWPRVKKAEASCLSPLSHSTKSQLRCRRCRRTRTCLCPTPVWRTIWPWLTCRWIGLSGIISCRTLILEMKIP